MACVIRYKPKKRKKRATPYGEAISGAISQHGRTRLGLPLMASDGLRWPPIASFIR